MLEIRLTESARLDLVEIGQYTGFRWDERQKSKYLGDIDKCLHALAQEPGLGRDRGDLRPGCFSCSVGKHVIFYSCESETLYVLAILHQRMDYERHL